MLEIPRIDPSAYVAPTAQIHGAVIIEARAVVMFGAVMRAEVEHIRVGVESNVQDNVVFHVDEEYPLEVGSRVTVGHAAVLHGCTVGDHALIGIGAIAMNGSTIGEGAWLAAGSLLAPGKTIPPWTLAAGTPARPVRELRDLEIAAQNDGVEQYLRFGELYRASWEVADGMEEPFVPDAFEVPASFQGPGFRLEPLGTIHNERDHDAWMSSIDHIRSTPGFAASSSWPVPMDLERNREDLAAHADDFKDRTGFTYSVLDGDEVVGCVYIYPSRRPGADAEVRSWVRQSQAAMDPIVWRALSDWIDADWPFLNPYYAPRD